MVGKIGLIIWCVILLCIALCMLIILCEKFQSFWFCFGLVKFLILFALGIGGDGSLIYFRNGSVN